MPRFSMPSVFKSKPATAPARAPATAPATAPPELQSELTTPNPIPGTTSALPSYEQTKLKEEIEKAIIEMAYENWVFNSRSKFRHSNSVQDFYKNLVSVQVSVYQKNYFKYLELLINTHNMITIKELKKLQDKQKTFLVDFHNAKDELQSVWNLDKQFGTSTNLAMLQEKTNSINTGLKDLESILNTYYRNIIETLKEDVVRLKLDHLIDIEDIDVLISEEKLKIHDAYQKKQVSRRDKFYDEI